MKKLALAIAASAMAVTGLGTAAPALADPPHWAPAHGKRDKEAKRYYKQGQAYQPRYYQSPRGVQYWEGEDGRYYCKRSNGTTGLIVGAAGGALLGRAIDTRGDRTLGTVIGAAAGALIGRRIDQGEVRCR